MTEGAARRLAKLPRAALTAEQRVLYDSILDARTSTEPQPFRLVDDDGCLEGPFNAMLLSPGLGNALQGLGAAIRFDGTLTPRSREIAILVVASGLDCGFERQAHQAMGRTVGLSEDELAAIEDGSFSALRDDHERAIADVTAALVRCGDLTDEEFRAASARFGLPTLFELTTLVGYYTLLATQLRVFRA